MLGRAFGQIVRPGDGLGAVDPRARHAHKRASAAHRQYGKETSSITMFDVHNVQFLARRLIMETAGLLPPR